MNMILGHFLIESYVLVSIFISRTERSCQKILFLNNKKLYLNNCLQFPPFKEEK